MIEQIEKKTDSELVQLACQGIVKAMDILLRRYQPLMMRTALRITGHSAAIADEVVQEASLTICLSLEQLHEPEYFRSWIFTIVSHIAYRMSKEQQKRPYSLEQIIEYTDEPEALIATSKTDPQEHVEAAGLQQELLEAINALSEKEAQAVILFYYQELSIQEIAIELNISETAVKSRLFKARRRLRQSLISLEITHRQRQTSLRSSISNIESRKRSQKMEQSINTITHFNSIISRLAYEEARNLNQSYIDTEHILLSLLSENKSNAAQWLFEQNIDIQQVRQMVVEQYSAPSATEQVAHGLTLEAIRVIAVAREYAHQLQCPHVIPEHLLLSLLVHKTSHAAKILSIIGIDVEHFSQEVIERLEVTTNQLDPVQKQLLLSSEAMDKLLKKQSNIPTDALNTHENDHDVEHINIDVDQTIYNLQKMQQKELERIDMNDPRYQEAKRAFEGSIRRLKAMKRTKDDVAQSTASVGISYTDILYYSGKEKERLGHSVLSSGHLLLGLLALQSGTVAQILDILDIDRQQLRSHTEVILAHQVQTPSLTNISEDADLVLQVAFEEAQQYGQNIIGGEHVLLSLLKETPQELKALLQQAGLKEELVRTTLPHLEETNF